MNNALEMEAGSRDMVGTQGEKTESRGLFLLFCHPPFFPLAVNESLEGDWTQKKFPLNASTPVQSLENAYVQLLLSIM